LPEFIVLDTGFDVVVNTLTQGVASWILEMVFEQFDSVFCKIAIV